MRLRRPPNAGAPAGCVIREFELSRPSQLVWSHHPTWEDQSKPRGTRIPRLRLGLHLRSSATAGLIGP